MGTFVHKVVNRFEFYLILKDINSGIFSFFFTGTQLKSNLNVFKDYCILLSLVQSLIVKYYNTSIISYIRFFLIRNFT